MPFFGSSLNVGALVEPLTSQMAEYLGVPNGLMVKQVARKSEAATAGLKAFDVILKVGSDGIKTLADWDRSLRANQGKPVQVTILRDKKQQTLTLQVDSKRHGELEIEEIFPAGDCTMVAEIDPEFAQQLGTEAQAAAQSLRAQAEALKGQNFAIEEFKVDPKQMEQLKQQMEEFRKNFKVEEFKLDSKQMDEMKQQMDQFRMNFKIEDFKLDPKQTDEMKQQMEQLKRQMEEWKAFDFGDRI
jgi:membrane-associated protease RseP (regulator of RpoE activity)